MVGFVSKRRWIRYAHSKLQHLFPYSPGQSGYNRRQRKAADLIARVNRQLATDTSLWTDNVWVVDSTPIESGRSHETVKRSDLAGWVAYGCYASHSRFFWGLQLHLVCILHGLPVTFVFTGANADGRTTLLDILDTETNLVAARPGQILIGEKNSYGAAFERELAELEIGTTTTPVSSSCARWPPTTTEPLALADEDIRHPGGRPCRAEAGRGQERRRPGP